jgi:hypothetical protein
MRAAIDTMLDEMLLNAFLGDRSGLERVNQYFDGIFICTRTDPDYVKLDEFRQSCVMCFTYPASMRPLILKDAYERLVNLRETETDTIEETGIRTAA